MTIKLVAVDMDGTFLKDDDTYNQKRFGRIFKRMLQQGVHFVAASGSQYQRLVATFGSWSPDMDFVSENGALVYHQARLLASAVVAPEITVATVHQLATLFPADQAQIMLTGVTGAYVDADRVSAEAFRLTQRYYSQLQRWPNLYECTVATLPEPIIRIGLSFAPDVDQAEVLTHLTATLEASLQATYSGYSTYIIGAKQVNKASGLQTLLTHYQLAPNEMMVFGDQTNDLPMLALTPHSYAMANAAKSVQQAATYLAPSNNDEGVLTILEQNWG